VSGKFPCANLSNQEYCKNDIYDGSWGVPRGWCFFF
jgi:hypothetical protein